MSAVPLPYHLRRQWFPLPMVTRPSPRCSTSLDLSVPSLSPGNLLSSWRSLAPIPDSLLATQRRPPLKLDLSVSPRRLGTVSVTRLPAEGYQEGTECLSRCSVTFCPLMLSWLLMISRSFKILPTAWNFPVTRHCSSHSAPWCDWDTYDWSGPS